MKLYDNIQIITDKYENEGIPKGTKGSIVFAEIRNARFEVELFGLPKEVYPIRAIKIEDMEVIKSANVDDKTILDELPNNDPKWWCKAENGFILNLLGEKKNKIPYKYNS